MRDLGFLLFGIVDGLVLVGVFAGLAWAAINDGRDEQSVRVRLQHPALVPVAAGA